MEEVGWILAALFVPVIILVGIIFVRAWRGGSLEIGFPDVAIAVLPVLLALLVAGKITEFTVGPEGLALKALEEAASASVETPGMEFTSQKVNPQELQEAEKLGPTAIPKYLKDNVQALKFEIGKSYVPDIMEAYFRSLTRNPGFRYFVLLEPGNRRLFGAMDARRLLALTEKPVWRDHVEPVLTWADVKHFVENDPDGFRELKGFIPSEKAIRTRDSRLDALIKLEASETDWLPVVDDEVRLVGIIELSRLTASLLHDVLVQLHASPEDTE